ncbi:MFS transporter [Catenuloplanes atrovinosus]|uniref:MFS family arabinose efflux permease n=1 Tax=Catenuloplanes atrovinosus TaxID=137266 RepID=A0AAE4CC24_9ACTN|nr:MFS transporter [Catenuloplanes atrovinosus]MDR7278713.1 putative MFS family arabinose efflux permease [Catenuloplanes atrovinosus]
MSAQTLPAPGAVVRRGVGHGTGFWVVAAAFGVAMAFTVVPTPLWPLYQREAGYSTLMVTVAYAAYAVGVTVSLFLAGHLSDRLGRRRVLVPALGVEIASGVLLLATTAFPAVLVGRALSGVAVGMITATATAHLAELHAVARPSRGRGLAELVGTAANMGGFAVGSLTSGLLAEWAGAPLRTPYAVYLVLLAAVAIGLALVPETVTPPAERVRYRPQRVAVPAAARGRFATVAAGAFAAFAVLGLFASVAPGFVGGTMGHPSRALAGLVAFLTFGSAVTAQLVFARVAARRQVLGGLVSLSLGLLTATVAVWLPHLPLFLLGGVAAGAGAGLLFKGSVGTVFGLSEPATRGEALAGLFLAGYLGLSIPILGFGLATAAVSTEVALAGFAASVVALAAVVAVRLVREAR